MTQYKKKLLELNVAKRNLHWISEIELLGPNNSAYPKLRKINCFADIILRIILLTIVHDLINVKINDCTNVGKFLHVLRHGVFFQNRDCGSAFFFAHVFY